MHTSDPALFEPEDRVTLACSAGFGDCSLATEEPRFVAGGWVTLKEVPRPTPKALAKPGILPLAPMASG
jgi:hypothetical protein